MTVMGFIHPIIIIYRWSIYWSAYNYRHSSLKVIFIDFILDNIFI